MQIYTSSQHLDKYMDNQASEIFNEVIDDGDCMMISRLSACQNVLCIELDINYSSNKALEDELIRSNDSLATLKKESDLQKYAIVLKAEKRNIADVFNDPDGENDYDEYASVNVSKISDIDTFFGRVSKDYVYNSRGLTRRLYEYWMNSIYTEDDLIELLDDVDPRTISKCDLCDMLRQKKNAGTIDWNATVKLSIQAVMRKYKTA